MSEPVDIGDWDIERDRGLDASLVRINALLVLSMLVVKEDKPGASTLATPRDVVSCPGSEQVLFTATFVPRLSNSIKVASFSFEIVVFWIKLLAVACWDTCCAMAFLVRSFNVFDAMPDVTMVIVFDNVFTFLVFRKVSASPRRRVDDRGAVGIANEPLKIEKRQKVIRFSRRWEFSPSNPCFVCLWFSLQSKLWRLHWQFEAVGPTILFCQIFCHHSPF